MYFVTYEVTRNPKHFLASICVEMGIPSLGQAHELMDSIADELNSKPYPLLIIDECDKMNNKTFMYLHVLRNRTMDNAGIVLSGVETLKSNLEIQVLRKRQGMEEFHSRIETWQPLQRPTKPEIKEICLKNGVIDEMTIKSFYGVKHFRELARKIKDETIKSLID